MYSEQGDSAPLVLLATYAFSKLSEDDVIGWSYLLEFNEDLVITMLAASICRRVMSSFEWPQRLFMHISPGMQVLWPFLAMK